MNKNLYENLIKACNKCILSCEASLKNCNYYSDKNNLSDDDKEDCGARHQDLISNCQSCIHECNLILENKETTTQESMIKKCKDTCKETIDKCQESINKILNKEKDGAKWALEQINNCIMICDECIETLSKG